MPDEQRYRETERRLWEHVGLSPIEQRIQLAGVGVRVQIVGLPATDDQSEERLAEQWIDATLKPNFAAVNWPSWKRAAEYIPPYWSFRDFVESAWWKENGPLLIQDIERFAECVKTP